jgi:phosphoribosylanthranilate isomerase
MNPVRIKICGITRTEDALAAARLGVDAIGLVFYAPSPRAVTIEQAAAIVRALPPFVTAVGLFVNAGVDEVQAVLQQVQLDLLQFHGDESGDYCRQFQQPYIKVLRMNPALDIVRASEMFGDARGILLDSYVAGVHGGTGQAFDWTDVPAGLKKPIILAGGLTPDNVATAIETVRPWAVDVSGGVESAKGIKDSDKMAAFVEAVKIGLRT